MIIRMLLRLLAGIALVTGLVLGAHAARFVAKSERTEGVVERIDARDDRCNRSGKQGKRKYDCTRYTAAIRFAHAGRDYTVEVGAGKHKGHGQPLANADLRPGQRVPMLVPRDAPQEALHGTGASLRVWGGALLAFLFAAVLAFVSFVRNRSR